MFELCRILANELERIRAEKVAFLFERRSLSQAKAEVRTVGTCSASEVGKYTTEKTLKTKNLVIRMRLLLTRSTESAKRIPTAALQTKTEHRKYG
jgi:hypothetical protein